MAEDEVTGEMTEEKDLVTRFFEPWEDDPVDSWESAKAKIQEIVKAAPLPKLRRLVWRGITNSTYPMHSSLYRYLFEKLGQPPTEDQMVEAERDILNTARNKWRFGNLTSLEIFAQIRHYGGPTRLLDVSFNPLIALWFAVQPSDEDKKDNKPVDGRIIASAPRLPRIQLDELGGYEIPWGEQREPGRLWNYGALWRPSGYNERISAQNSGFLIGGVPRPSISRIPELGYPKDPEKIVTRRRDDDQKMRFWSLLNKRFEDLNPENFWTIDEVKRVTSVNLKMQSIKNPALWSSSPAFTIRILGDAKKEIRRGLERQFGYTEASLYPDLYGLAEHVKESIYLDVLSDPEKLKQIKAIRERHKDMEMPRDDFTRTAAINRASKRLGFGPK